MPSENSFQGGAKLFYIVFLLTTLLMSIVLIIINVHIDPRGLFGTGKYPILVATARTEKSILLKKRGAKPQCLILGDSTLMRYSPELVRHMSGYDTFNYAVNSGKSEDFLALFKYAQRELKIDPKLLIVGVRPRTFRNLEAESFDKRLVMNQYLYQQIPLNYFIKKLKISQAYFETMSWAYYKDLKQSYLMNKRDEAPLISEYRFDENGFLKKDIISKDKAEDFRNVNSTFEEYEKKGYSKIRLELFNRLLELCQQKNIDVKVVIIPNHSGFVRTLDGIDGSYTRITNQLFDLLIQRSRGNIEIFNYSKIENYGGVDEFSGGDHPGYYNSSLIINSLFREQT